MKRILLTAGFILITLLNHAIIPDEGMWIPVLIEKYNIKIMQEKGFKLTAEDIYSVNKACMKDAVVIFGGGCTGEIISPEGLLITNHHCGYGQIQRHSTLEHDYLTNGFWAMSREEELPNPGLTVTILKRMEDVTDRVLENINDQMSSDERERIIEANIEKIQKEALESTDYGVSVRPFFMGNQYFLFENEVFRDVRLVGAPPSSIGKFGGDTDNWIWPRHTGDFSVFRVYADKDNKPADYSEANVPYKPLYHFPVSLKGVKEGDFTMVFGYPGSTSEYVPSFYIDMVKNYLDPLLIKVRTKKLDILNAAINSDPLLRIKYSTKIAGISNSWKKWQGEILGLDKMNTISKKQEFESNLMNWIAESKVRQAKFGNILPEYKELYKKIRDYSLVNSFTSEIISGIETVAFSRNVRGLVSLYEKNAPVEDIDNYKTNLIRAAASFFKDYDMETDRKLFVSLMEIYGEALELKWQAPEYLKIKNECGGDFARLSNKIYENTPFSGEGKFVSFIKAFNKKGASKVEKDPFYLLSTGMSDFVAQNIRPELNSLGSELQTLNREYMVLQMKFDSTRVFYPDANSTLRVAYGSVGGYYPKDAVYYIHYTTLKGIIEKDNPEIYDYDVPDKLKELYANSDFGRYGENGELPVCFIANNHTTGGNSGSPVLNGDGQLIGINFDRAWEGVASDMAFNPAQSRNISLDIRYALFIIDKFAGAGYLLDEMTIKE
jgi:hypothetical protein